MSDDNIIDLGFSSNSRKRISKEEVDTGKSRENHFYLQTFLKWEDANNFINDKVDEFDKEEYFVGMSEIRNINGGYQAGVSIFKKQGELFE